MAAKVVSTSQHGIERGNKIFVHGPWRPCNWMSLWVRSTWNVSRQQKQTHQTGQTNSPARGQRFYEAIYHERIARRKSLNPQFASESCNLQIGRKRARGRKREQVVYICYLLYSFCKHHQVVIATWGGYNWNRGRERETYKIFAWTVQVPSFSHSTAIKLICFVCIS